QLSVSVWCAGSLGLARLLWLGESNTRNSDDHHGAAFVVHDGEKGPRGKPFSHSPYRRGRSALSWNFHHDGSRPGDSPRSSRCPKPERTVALLLDVRAVIQCFG